MTYRTQWNPQQPYDVPPQPPWPYGYHEERTTVVPRPGGRGSGKGFKVAVGLVAAALGLAGAATWAVVGAGSASANEVQLEAVSTPGASPFLAPVGRDKAGVTPPAGAGGTFRGDTAGLYGSDKAASCDTSALVSGLQADPVKSTAWASAMKIPTENIPSFVTSLNPVLLRSDTAVTDYGFRAGTFAPAQAVLQSGTAVLVNGYGEPTVKCFSGDPLGKPSDLTGAQFTGQPWEHFDPANYTVVEPTSTVVSSYQVVDVVDNHAYEMQCKPYPWPHNPEPEHPKHEDGDKDPGKDTGKNPGTDQPPPDPAKDPKVIAAQMAADMAHQDARAARDKADDLKNNIVAVQGKVNDADARAQGAQNALDAAAKKAASTPLDPFNPGSYLIAQQELAQAQLNAAQARQTATDAHTELETAMNMAKYADAAATSAEGTATQADKNVDTAKQDATKNGKPGDKPATLNGDEQTATTDGATTDGATTDGAALKKADQQVTDPQTTDAQNTPGATGTTDDTSGTGTTGTTGAPTTDPAGQPATTDPAGQPGGSVTGTVPGAPVDGTVPGAPADATTGPGGPQPSPFMQGTGPVDPNALPNGNTGVAGQGPIDQTGPAQGPNGAGGQQGGGQQDGGQQS